MTQITGHAEFCELFLDDVVVPKENLLGERGDGWKIAMHTLGHERGTAALPARSSCARGSTAPCASPPSAVDGRPLLDDPRVAGRARAGAVRLEVLRHHAYRTVGEFLNGGAVGPDSSSVKLLMAEAEQRLAATALEILSPTLQHAEPAAPTRTSSGTRPTSTRAPRASTAARSRSSATSSPTASWPCPRSRRMDLELTDEQTWLGESLRRCSSARRPSADGRVASGWSSSARWTSAARTGSARSSCA